MVVKVKEPQPEEWRRLRPGQILFTYLHLAPDPEQARGLMESGCTAIAYETVTDAHGGLPLLAPMSEVAGRMAVQVGAHCLERESGGAGFLPSGPPAPDPERAGGLMESGCPATAYEPVPDAHGGLPLPAPMSEVAGRMAVQVGANCLDRESAGAGTLLSAVPGVPGARVAIIG